MNLAADQIFEITTAVHCGLKVADLGALSAAERAHWVAQVKAHASKRLADPALSVSERELLKESVDLADQPDVMAQRARDRYYGRSVKERGRNLSGQRMAMDDLLSQSHYFFCRTEGGNR